MKKAAIPGALVFLICIVSGCGPSEHSYTLQERRQIIDNMADQALERLYIERPSTRQEVSDAAGYAVFSNANIYIIFASAGGGYGVAVDKTTGGKTYMRLGSGGVGIGIGAKDYRQVVLFRTRQAFINFVGSGWNLGGQAEATAKTGEAGKALAGDTILSKDVAIYTITETGLALQATVTGVHYWVDDELNQPGF